LKYGCPIPPTCTEWKLHKKQEAETWEYAYLDRQYWFGNLMDVEKGEKPPKKESNQVSSILCDTKNEEMEEFEVLKKM
jgi:hypothetical protein